jgi:outer membrane protein
MRSRLTKPAGALLAALVVLLPTEAGALQPLSTFLSGAHERNPDAVVASATVRQRDAEVDLQRSRLLPSFGARGILTHNQYPAVVTLPGGGPAITIIPQNQLDAFFVLDVPIVDLSQFARVDAQKLQRTLAEATRGLTLRQLEERVIRSYYTLTATAALGRSADKSLELAQKNLDVVRERVKAGVSPEVDLERAIANVERANQDVADAELSRVLASRSLETLSRVAPEPPTAFPEDALQEEAALAGWLDRGKANLPELRVAATEIELAEANRKAARYAYLPTLAAQAQERLTNATGFTGKVASYTLSATLSYRFDLGVLAQQDIARAAADQSQARAEGTRRATEDAIVEAWQRVKTNIAKARSSRAQLRATESAARLTLDRYQAGAGTQLDVTQAQRDAFTADVARIQADLELTQSRAILRLASGETAAPPAAAPPAAAPPAAAGPSAPRPSTSPARDTQ